MNIEESNIPDLIKQGLGNDVVKHLYKKVFPLVSKYIKRRTGTEDDAFDVFQDAIIAFHKQVLTGRFNPKYKVYGYLFRISINYWINKLNKDKKLVGDEELEQWEDVENAPLEEKMNSTEPGILRELFSSIGEKCLELLQFSIYTDMLMEDIATRMGFTSVNAVKMQQVRCKQKLIQEIEKNPLLLNRLKR